MCPENKAVNNAFPSTRNPGLMPFAICSTRVCATLQPVKTSKARAGLVCGAQSMPNHNQIKVGISKTQGLATAYQMFMPLQNLIRCKMPKDDWLTTRTLCHSGPLSSCERQKTVGQYPPKSFTTSTGVGHSRHHCSYHLPRCRFHHS